MFPPIILLADSQLLFLNAPREDLSFLRYVAEFLDHPIRGAAYLGASNGDRAEYWELFSAAIGVLGPMETRHVKGDAEPDELAFLDDADLLLLAGGDVQRGLCDFARSGAQQKIVNAYLRGALLIGVSAGAVQLGNAEHLPAASNGHDAHSPLPGFRLLPFIVDTHAGPDWSVLRQAVARAGSGARGLGISAGGGAIYHRDGSLEPVRHPLIEIFSSDDGSLHESMVLPDKSAKLDP